MSPSRKRVPSALDQHVADLALVVDGTPQIHPLARNPHHHLVDSGRSAEGEGEAEVVEAEQLLYSAATRPSQTLMLFN